MTEEPPQPNAERPDDPAPTPPPDVPAEDAPTAGDAAPSAGDEDAPAVDGPPTADDTPPPAEAAPAAEGPEAEAGTPEAAGGDSSEAEAEAEAEAESDAEGERPDPSPAPAPGEGPSEPAAPAPSGPAGETVSEAPGPAEETVPPVADAAPADASEEAPSVRERPERAPRPRGRRDREESAEAEEVIPGANLEPDLVLDEPARTEGGDEFAAYEQPEPEGEPVAEAPAVEPPAEGDPAPRSVLDLAADARYRATGKRKTSVARVILRPGSGTYAVNGRTLEAFFPRRTLQQVARSPLETAGYTSRMDVVAKIHGGGVSAQAGALRHGIARALVEADPNLRGELKRAGFLTRDARAKERKKAGLKKARKRPQFSKR